MQLELQAKDANRNLINLVLVLTAFVLVCTVVLELAAVSYVVWLETR